MTDKFMYIPIDCTQNYPFCILQFNPNSIKVPKVVEPTNKKMLLLCECK